MDDQQIEQPPPGTRPHVKAWRERNRAAGLTANGKPRKPRPVQPVGEVEANRLRRAEKRAANIAAGLTYDGRPREPRPSRAMTEEERLRRQRERMARIRAGKAGEPGENSPR